jgi:cell wall-associated NlpC family hydrolase
VGERFGTSVRTQRAGARWVRRVIGVGAATVVCLAVAPGAASAVPTAPSDSQISAAQQAKDAAAARVGAITAQLAQAQAAADAAHQAALVALQDYEQTQAAYEAARATADAAAAAAAQAAAQLQQGRDDVASFARASYKQGSTSPGVNALLSSGGPAELLERAALLDAAGVHHTDVVSALTVLEDQAVAAEEIAQQAVGEAATLQTRAADQLAAAQVQEVGARSQAEALSVQQDDLEAELEQAQQTVYGLEGARAAAQAAASARAAAESAVPARTPVRVDTPAPSSSRPPSGSSSSAGPAPAPVRAPAGAPSASAAQTAIAAAQSQIGVLYSWGGGGSNGPSYGISPDTAVFGFDCSGLVQYAYARAGIAVGGTSRDQWWLNRDKQVAADDLKPGDLMFWGSGSDYTTIYHVSIYIGNNQMVEAPKPGTRVMTAKVRFGNDYYGAVRPSA